VDTYGRPVDYRIESLHEVGRPNEELVGQIQGLVFRGAFQGKTYEFRAAPLPQRREFPAFKEKILVGEASKFALFVVPESIYLPDSAGPYPITRLVLKPAPPTAAGATWATVQPTFVPQIYDPGTETVAVSSDGMFTLHGLHGGRYTITICRDEGILGTALVDIPLLGPPNPIEVRLR
jgi:hypothetical protein